MKKIIWLIVFCVGVLAVCNVDAQPVELKPPPEKVIKVVPVEFCVVKGDMAPNGRLNPLIRLAGLLLKSLIWAQADILFKPQSVVMIDGPVPPKGAFPGDVLQGEPGKQSAEEKKVRQDCQKAIGRDHKEKLIDILIRRFVDAAGMPTGKLGRTLKVPVSKLNTLPDKAMVRDPGSFAFFFRCVRAGGMASFVRTLAHEDGHALSLQHPPGMPVSRLMSQTGVTSSCGLTAAEGAQARREADEKLSGVVKKNKQGQRLAEPKPRARASVDDIGDVTQAFIDITEVVAVRRADGALGLEMALAGLLPDDITGLKFVFMVDVDNDIGTGGSPAVGFPHSFFGADLVVEITVSKAAGVPSVAAVVKRFEQRQFVDIVDPRIEAEVVTVLEAVDFETVTSEPDEFPVFDSVKFVLPADLLPLPLAEGFRVGSFAFDSNTSHRNAD